MRAAPLILAGLIAGASFVAAAPADAQETRIIIRKQQPRSYLDPGTIVKPGSARYLNYVYAAQPRYPSYGDNSTITGNRYPLPGPYYLPGY
jgi:hypothetical protein